MTATLRLYSVGPSLVTEGADTVAPAAPLRMARSVWHLQFSKQSLYDLT